MEIAVVDSTIEVVVQWIRLAALPLLSHPDFLEGGFVVPYGALLMLLIATWLFTIAYAATWFVNATGSRSA